MKDWQTERETQPPAVQKRQPSGVPPLDSRQNEVGPFSVFLRLIYFDFVCFVGFVFVFFLRLSFGFVSFCVSVCVVCLCVCVWRFEFLNYNFLRRCCFYLVLIFFQCGKGEKKKILFAFMLFTNWRVNQLILLCSPSPSDSSTSSSSSSTTLETVESEFLMSDE